MSPTDLRYHARKIHFSPDSGLKKTQLSHRLLQPHGRCRNPQNHVIFFIATLD
jgi:hypothetical protein